MEKSTDNTNSYNDIMELPHHVSASHPRMEISDRAAQFAPFSALAGHDAAVKETARLTNRKIEPDENHKEILNRKLLRIMEKLEKQLEEQLEEQPVITITYFVPDSKKEGGHYVTAEGGVKKLDAYRGNLILLDNTQIFIEDILEIEESTCVLFPEEEI